VVVVVLLLLLLLLLLVLVVVLLLLLLLQTITPPATATMVFHTKAPKCRGVPGATTRTTRNRRTIPTLLCLLQSHPEAREEGVREGASSGPP